MKIIIPGIIAVILFAACTSTKTVPSRYVDAVSVSCGDLCK